MFCLPKFAAQEFKTRLKSGEITPAKLMAMTSAQRNAYFSKFLTPEQAKATNALFESKVILKNQQQGMITWAKTVSGLKSETRRELIDKINRLDKVLTPEEEKAFLADLAGTRLGVDVTADEANKIAELASKVNETKLAMEAGGDRMEYGRAKVALDTYVADLKRDADSIKLADFNADRLGTTGRAISSLAGQSKSVTASLDNSAIFNQGWKPFMTNPILTAKNAVRTYGDIVNTLGGKKVMDEVNAELVSRPTYDLMKKAKLAVGTSEEAFPTSLPEKVDKIPGVGPALTPLSRLYKASQDAYTAFVHRTRADIFDKMVKVAERNGTDLDKKELEAIGAMVNSLTGRGGFGKLEGPAVDAFNNIFFSPRFFKSQVDVLTQPITGAGRSNFVRKQAAQNLIKILGGTAIILGIAQQVASLFGYDDAVEWDSRSADFGSIKIGNTRYKLGGGLPGVLTLLSRIIPTKDKGDWGFYTKSSTTGKITKLNEDTWGARSVGDVIGTFAGNKFSPAFQLLDDWWVTGVDFDGERPTVLGSALKLITPFGVSTYQELAKDPEAEKLFTMILAGHGINVSNYGD